MLKITFKEGEIGRKHNKKLQKQCKFVIVLYPLAMVLLTKKKFFK